MYIPHSPISEITQPSPKSEDTPPPPKFETSGARTQIYEIPEGESAGSVWGFRRSSTVEPRQRLSPRAAGVSLCDHNSGTSCTIS